MGGVMKWDLFCTVVDNYGDIGVCWRIARALHERHGIDVVLWVDNLVSFARLYPEIDINAPVQMAAGIEVRHWVRGQEPTDSIGAVVIEAFACELSDTYLHAMAACQPAPLWLNLEYLSAESWVEGCHGFSSLHPTLPLKKYFFFPGFSGKTGGVLGPDIYPLQPLTLAQKQAWWARLGIAPLAAGEESVFVFSYETPALQAWVEALAQRATPIHLLVPEDRASALLGQALAGRPWRAGETFVRNGLSIHVIPFVDQREFDALLQLCDWNIVRGEDSFVRAQWAGKPFIWHIYPQEDAAHLAKLEAFLARYCAGQTAEQIAALHAAHMAWNAPDQAQVFPAACARWQADHSAWQRHAKKWTQQLESWGDLAANLVSFYKNQL